ncbi:PfkB domain protein [Crinalium epipsammum PCC 9333]|uniref:PfkB domain protein n=1 Tax=Crinalium epipsammum PCC 9333 TaxID=1173022 RepID=K9VV91_9CYAN|nr:sugar kinase [Crinalium epipsammum]AFZ11065.1 PfkB domain protein [Crinalium epipsammum PCC 9333]
MAKKGLFVGLVTLDFVYLATAAPSNNQKVVALDYTVTAGGPATNAAVAFSHLGNQATLLGVVGNHPITHLIQADLGSYQIAIADLAPNHPEPPPVSSIIITKDTGDRAVISLNATKAQIPIERIPADILQGVDIVLIDGHQMEIGCAIAQIAQTKNIPVVLDGGSWKPGLEKLLPFVDYAICSANFYPPNCHQSEDLIAYLSSIGISHIAITHGEKPIQYCTKGDSGYLDVPKISVVDTLGAGDIFHGAFCHYILEQNLIDTMKAATNIAAHSCQFFGTRRWMNS